MNRLKTTAFAAVAGLVPCAVWALGLGDIQVNSKLNQALNAEIELIYDSESEPQSTEVGLASAEDFRRVGLDPVALTAKLDFQVQRNDAGQYVIAVTSRDVITDPFVDFLIDVNWPNGRLLREYVVLLDPPVTPPSGPAEVVPAAQQPTSEPPSAAAAPVRTAERSPGTMTPGPAGGNYEVRKGDTLWEIARDSRTGDTTINQMMLALFRLNPDAFFQDNINALKAGAVLRMPDQGESLEQSVREAMAAVRTQNEAWENYRRSASGRAPVVSDQSADADYVDRTRESTGSRDSQLKLVPPASESNAGTGSGSDADREQLKSLREDLARSREDLVSSRQENTELGSRVESLENLVANLERTISLKDADLADLQNQFELNREQAAADGTAEPADAGFDDELAAIEQELDAAGSEADDSQALDAAMDAATGEEVADSVAADAQEATSTPVRSAPGFMDKAMAMVKRPLVWGSAVGIALLALVVTLLARRRGDADGQGGESLVDQMMSSNQATSEMPAALLDTAGEQDADDMPDLSQLREAVSANPENAQPHLALLRVHHAAEDRHSFIDAARQMHDAVGGAGHPAWMEVRAMGQSLAPDHPLFADAGDTDELQDDDLAFDLPDNEQPADTAQADDGGFDLNLDIDDDGLDLDLGDAGSDLDAGLDLDDSLAEQDAASERPDDSIDLEGPATLTADDDELALDFDLDAGGDVAESDFDLDLDLDSIDLGSGDGADSTEKDDVHTEFEIPAVDAGKTAEIELDLAGRDDLAREESQTLAELEAADGDLDDLGLDDLDLDNDELFGDEDAVGTKLDLAKAYIDMGDPEGARGMLEEVITEGSDPQKSEAQGLLDRLA